MRLSGDVGRGPDGTETALDGGAEPRFRDAYLGDGTGDRPLPVPGDTAQDVTPRWNLFRKIEREDDVDELARSLFPDDDGGSGEFFDAAARQVFAAVVKMARRESENPTNADIIEYFRHASAEDLYDDLGDHPDFAAARSALNPDAAKQAGGVYATVQQQIADVFVGAFADAGGFSVREYMEDPQGRVLVLDYSQRYGESAGLLFRFLIDRATSLALADPDRPAQFVLDEFARLPALQRIESLVNVGRGVDTGAILGVQSVSQVYATYGKARGRALLAGLPSAVLLRCGDRESTEFARERVGTTFETYTRHTEERPGGLGKIEETKDEEEHEFAKGEFGRFKPGEGIIVRPDGWVKGRLQMLDKGA